MDYTVHRALEYTGEWTIEYIEPLLFWRVDYTVHRALEYTGEWTIQYIELLNILKVIIFKKYIK